MKWLLKSDPETYSFADLVRDRKTRWDGVSNNTALMHIRAMQKGDEALIYHTGGERTLVGTATIASDPYPDPNESDPRLVVVDLKAGRKLKRPVGLDEIKRQTELATFDLVRIGRLSVMPVSDDQWAILMRLADTP